MTQTEKYNKLLCIIFLKQSIHFYEAHYEQDIEEYEQLLREAPVKHTKAYLDVRVPKMVEAFRKKKMKGLEDLLKIEDTFHAQMSEDEIAFCQELSTEMADINNLLIGSCDFTGSRAALMHHLGSIDMEKL
jgi:hypothetical protein